MSSVFLLRHFSLFALSVFAIAAFFTAALQLLLGSMSALLVLEFFFQREICSLVRWVGFNGTLLHFQNWRNFIRMFLYVNLLFWLGFLDIALAKWCGQVEVQVSHSAFSRVRGARGCLVQVRVWGLVLGGGGRPWLPAWPPRTLFHVGVGIVAAA